MKLRKDERCALKLRDDERRALKLRADERRSLKLRRHKPSALKLRKDEQCARKPCAVHIGLAQIGIGEISAFEVPPAQNQSMLDAIELFRIVDLRRFERVECWKHESVRKETPAPAG